MTYLCVWPKVRNNDTNPYLIILQNNKILYSKSLYRQPYTDEKGYPSYTVVTRSPDNAIYVECNLANPIIPNKLYSENGMYFSYMRDIPKFDQKLAYNLDVLYNSITLAESDREYIQSHLDTTNETRIDALDNQYFVSYMDMRFNIMKSSSLINETLNELNNESSQNITIDNNISPVFYQKNIPN